LRPRSVHQPGAGCGIEIGPRRTPPQRFGEAFVVVASGGSERDPYPQKRRASTADYLAGPKPAVSVGMIGKPLLIVENFGGTARQGARARVHARPAE
jgi:hypothetical protein